MLLKHLTKGSKFVENWHGIEELSGDKTPLEGVASNVESDNSMDMVANYTGNDGNAI